MIGAEWWVMVPEDIGRPSMTWMSKGLSFWIAGIPVIDGIE